MILLWILISLFVFFFVYCWRYYIYMFKWRSKTLTTIADCALYVVIGIMIGLVIFGLIG